MVLRAECKGELSASIVGDQASGLLCRHVHCLSRRVVSCARQHCRWQVLLVTGSDSRLMQPADYGDTDMVAEFEEATLCPRPWQRGTDCVRRRSRSRA